MEEKNREKFASRIGFILVSAGCAVGLGNVWKFPYICGQNGGAAFVLIYLLCLIMLGGPILICEFSVGRASRKSLGSALKVLSPEGSRWHKFRWFAYAGNYLLMMFYAMVAGWIVKYVFIEGLGMTSGKQPSELKDIFGDVLAKPLPMIFWTLLVIFMCIGVCALGLQNGVEKITKVMMLLLIVLMIVMAVNSVVFLDSSEGLKFYLIPDFERMKEHGIGNVIFAAMTHAFFTLSVGMGTMEIFGSYINRDNRLTGEAVNVMILDTVIALTAGLIIIPACFAYGVNPDAGPSLLFITLPNVFNYMAGGRVWGIMFFVFMSFAALSTVIAVFENIIAMTMDMFGWERKKSVIINLFIISVLSIPAVLGYNVLSFVEPLGTGTTIMDLEDFLVSYNILPLGSLLMVLFCTRKGGWGYGNFLEEADTGSGMKFPKHLQFYMTYIVPLLIVIIYFKGYYDNFAPQGIAVLVKWMVVAALFVAFIVFLASGKGNYNEGKKEKRQQQ